MTIDELTEKSKIEFPRLIDLDEAEKLIDYIAEILPANIDYQKNQHKSIMHSNINDAFIKADGTSKVIATITSLKNPVTFDTCQFNHSSQNRSKLETIQFQCGAYFPLPQ